MLVITLGMSLESAHASTMDGLPYGQSQPLNGASSPSAYYYNGRTYVTWQGQNLDPYVAYYTNATGKWTGPVRVGANPLTRDDHGPPAILVDNNGCIHITYGSHNSAQKYARSTNREDISTWTAMPDLVGASDGSTYPQLIKDSSGYIHLVYRTSRPGTSGSNSAEAIITSTDGGAKWSARQVMINVYTSNDPNGAIYLLGGGAEYESATNRIHLTWVRNDASSVRPADPDGARLNVYYAYLNLNDNNMYAIDGRNLGATIDQTEADAHCKAVDSGIHTTNMARVRVDSAGNPYIIYSLRPQEVVRSDWQYVFTRWTGSAWSTPVAIRTCGNLGSEFFVYSSTNIDAYLIAEPSGDVERWSWDGTDWAKVSTVAPYLASRAPLYYSFPMEVANGANLKIVFTEVNFAPDQYARSDLRIFTYDGSTLIVKRR